MLGGSTTPFLVATPAGSESSPAGQNCDDVLEKSHCSCHQYSTVGLTPMTLAAVCRTFIPVGSLSRTYGVITYSEAIVSNNFAGPEESILNLLNVNDSRKSQDKQPA